MSTSTSDKVAPAPAPEGYVVDFDNPQRRDVLQMYLVSGFCMIVTLLLVIQRLYVKIYIRRKFGLDDVLLLIGWVTSLATQALILGCTANGELGIHIWEITVDHFKTYVFWNTYVDPIVYAIPPCCCKLAILMFYLEVNSVSVSFRWSVYVTMFVVIGWSAGIFFSSIFPCYPIHSAYDLVTPGQCIDRIATYEFNAILGVITDVMIIVIPIPMVISLHMSRAKKIGLMLLFGVGSLTVVTSIIRLVLLMTVLDTTDVTWVAIYINTWVNVEASLLVICACMSTLRLFFSTVTPNLFSSQKATTNVSGKVSNPGQLTFGGGGGGSGTANKSRKRSQYDRFDDTTADPNDKGYALETLDIESGRGARREIRGNLNGREDDRAWYEDGRSDKGILQTTTMTVTVSKV